MDAKQLLREWPEWSRAGAARVLASPAWRMDVRFDGEIVPMTRGEALPAAVLPLSVRLDDAPHALDLALSPRFPDLWRLREKWADLPREVLLVLLEKECGSVFHFLEDTFHGLFALVGVRPSVGTGTVFSVALPDDPLTFALDLSPAMTIALGDLDHLDVTHESIRSLTTPAYARHAALAITESELKALQAGDFLVVSDAAASAAGWVRELPADDAVQVVAPERGTLTFAQLADEKLPPLPETVRFELYRRGTKFAAAETAHLGTAKALKIL